MTAFETVSFDDATIETVSYHEATIETEIEDTMLQRALQESIEGMDEQQGPDSMRYTVFPLD